MIQGSNNPFACDPALISTQNQIITETGFTLVDNDFTINANWSWSLFGNTITNPSPIVRNIPFAATGMHRIDIIVLNNTTAIRIAGEEVSVGSPRAEPLTPPNAIRVTAIPVNDDSFGEIIPPVIGSLYIEKKEKTEITDASTGAIDFVFVDQRAVVSFTDSVTILQSAELDMSTNYQNKKYTVENRQTTPITIEHLSSTGLGNHKFFFPNEEDFIVQPNEIFEFLQIKSATNDLILRFIGRVKINYNDLDNLPTINDYFKGKHTSLANLQSAHATSNDGDYAIVDAGSGTDALEYIWDTDEGWVKGNNTGAATTDALTEGSTNLYFQTARVLATVLTGISFATGGAIVSTDTVLQAFGKIQKQINDALTTIGLKEDSTNKATTMTGNTTSNVVFLSAKAIYDWAVGLFVPQTRTITINGTTQDLSVDRSFTVSSGVTPKIRTLTSADLSTLDIAGFKVYADALSPNLVIASNEFYDFHVTDTGQVFSYKKNGVTIGLGQTGILVGDVLETTPLIVDNIFTNKVLWKANGSASVGVGALALTGVGTASQVVNYGGFDFYLKTASAATAGTTISQKETSLFRILINTGFHYEIRVKQNDASVISDVRFVYGLGGSSAIGNVEPSTISPQLVTFGADGTDTNNQIIHKQSGVAATKINLGASSPKSQTHDYTVTFMRLKNLSTVYYKVFNNTTGDILTGSFSANTDALTPIFNKNNNASNISCAFEIQRAVLKIQD